MDKVTFSDLLAAGFPLTSEQADFSHWFDDITPTSSPRVLETKEKKKSSFRSPARTRPSDHGHSALFGATLFLEQGGFTLGTEVHNLLAGIEWADDTLPAGGSSLARRLVENFLLDPKTRQIFEQPTPNSIVWRERSLVCLLNGVTISAQMDRVIIQPPQTATSKGKIFLVDFKTDQGVPEEIASRYLSQMAAYVEILSAWSQGTHEITAAIAPIRIPGIILI